MLASAYMEDLVANEYAYDDIRAGESLNEVDFSYYATSIKEWQFSTERYMSSRLMILNLAAQIQELQDFDQSIGISPSQATRFDQALYEIITDAFPMGLYEGSKESTWTYITLKCLPDVANWRYPNTTKSLTYNRHIGTARNVFRRIWIRAQIAGDSQGILEELSEDQAVSIFERTSLTSNPAIAKALILVLNEIRLVSKDNAVYRDAFKRIRRISTNESLDAFSENDLRDRFRSEFQKSLKALKPELVI